MSLAAKAFLKRFFVNLFFFYHDLRFSVLHLPSFFTASSQIPVTHMHVPLSCLRQRPSRFRERTRERGLLCSAAANLSQSLAPPPYEGDIPLPSTGCMMTLPPDLSQVPLLPGLGAL